jgi:hypothetical protein
VSRGDQPGYDNELFRAHNMTLFLFCRRTWATLSELRLHITLDPGRATLWENKRRAQRQDGLSLQLVGSRGVQNT